MSTETDAAFPESLKPFRAAIVARITADAFDCEALLDEVWATLTGSLLEEKLEPAISRRDPITVAEHDRARLAYVTERPPPWRTDGPLDVLHHAVFCLRRGAFVALSVTEKERRRAVVRALIQGKLSGVAALRSTALKAALIEGRPRISALWLRGIHVPTTIRPSTKALTGPDLNDAIDPLTDQTFAYPALRFATTQTEIGRQIGLATTESRLWIGPSTTWADFERSIGKTLERLALEREYSEPLPQLAAVEEDPANVRDAREAALVPPGLFEPEGLSDEDHAALLELLDIELRIVDRAGLAAKIEVRDGTDVLGQVTAEPVPHLTGWALRVPDEDVAARPRKKGRLKRVAAHLRRPGTLSLHYGSGHTFADEVFFRSGFRDARFQRWSWVDFGGYDIEREKPETWDDDHDIPDGDRSLFGWVVNVWARDSGRRNGWLLCDDRDREAADFIHVDKDARAVTLVHVKAAESGAQRGINVVAYEKVVPQALKNLRHLHGELNVESLLARHVSAQRHRLVWRNGRRVRARDGQSAREQFIAHVRRLDPGAARSLVILQPHMQENIHAAAWQQPRESSEGIAIRQLDGLLLGLEGNAAGTGVTLEVVAAEGP